MIDVGKKLYPFVVPSRPRVVNNAGSATAPAASSIKPAQGSTVAMGTPPLKMVLLHFQDERPNAASTAYLSVRTNEEISKDDEALTLIVRLIEHLNKES